MIRNYKPYIPRTLHDLMCQLTFLRVQSPTFEDAEFPGRNVETAFFQLAEGLKNVRSELGEERYLALVSLSDRVRAHFEADPENNNGRTKAGRQLVLEMEALVEEIYPSSERD